jgi:hypothetical protein
MGTWVIQFYTHDGHAYELTRRPSGFRLFVFDFWCGLHPNIKKYSARFIPFP